MVGSLPAMARSLGSRRRTGVVLGAGALAVAVLVGLTAPPARAVTDPGTGPADPYAGRPLPTTTVVVGPVAPQLELSRFGVSVAGDPATNLFAGDPGATVERAHALLGEPDETTAYASGSPCVDVHGVDRGAPTTVASGVRWGDLTLYFDGAGILQSYRYGPKHAGDPAGGTANGIILGSTVADLRSAYGADLLIEDTATPWGHLWYQRGLAPAIGGFVSGATDDDTVTVINTGSCFRTLSGEAPPADQPAPAPGCDPGGLWPLLQRLWGWLLPIFDHLWPDDPAGAPADEPADPPVSAVPIP
jgi:hypothetical protein